MNRLSWAWGVAVVPTFHDFLVAYGQARIDHPAQ